ncbi:MAG: SDR family NAD(P)-dependent oxidoreductase [Geoalkalibacter sp.]|uniref:SDR family NAD(P)-dependent oxidoreductase n=1 Tax=Geoalkalibacter sp. TaxID=3041440 RepID=UPI003D0EBD8E
MLLKGKKAVLTGANRGIGKSILKLFAENGADVWACARTQSSGFEDFAAQLAAENQVSISCLYFDLNDEAAMKEAVKQIRSAKQPIDILVNNAGVIQTSLFQMTSLAAMKELFDTNFFSQMQLTQFILKLMLKSESGSIINISSSAAIEGNDGRSAYSASKAALIAVTKSMSKELGGHNIRVNAIAPGLTQTDMMVDSTAADALQETLARTCLKRVGRPDEIAAAVLFLASDLSSYMTGQTLRVDGGM